MVTSLSMDSDCGAAPVILVLSTRDSMSGHRHDEEDDEKGKITKVVDGGTTNQWCSLYPFPVRTIAGPKCIDHLTQLRVQPHIHHHNPPLPVRSANGVTSTLHS